MGRPRLACPHTWEAGHDRIRDFLPQLEELVTEGLVILDDCEVIRYVGTNPDGIGGGHSPLDTPVPDR